MIQTANWVGHLDGIEGHTIVGWLINKNNIEKTGTVSFWIDGNFVGRANANQHRDDLAKHKIGNNGKCSFSFSLPLSYCDGAEHKIEALADETGLNLQGSPLYFTISTKPGGDSALVGKEGWLFLISDSNKAIEQFTGKIKITKEALSTYEKIFQERRDFFSNKNIPFFFSSTPGKETIYPERLPEGLIPSRDSNTCDEVFKTARANNINVIDLRPGLLEAKKDVQVYHRIDHHWNHNGAFSAYQSIMSELSKLNPDLSPLPLEAYDVSQRPFKEGDLINKEKIIFRNHDFFHEKTSIIDPVDIYFHYEKKGGFKSTRTEVPEHLKVSNTRPTVIYEQKNKSLPRAVVFRSSSADWLFPFLNEHFSRITFIWQPFINRSVIESESPDFVIQLAVDRYLIKPPVS
jgi:hypothetical protein